VYIDCHHVEFSNGLISQTNHAIHVAPYSLTQTTNPVISQAARFGASTVLRSFDAECVLLSRMTILCIDPWYKYM
jgi:hypothetical protein